MLKHIAPGLRSAAALTLILLMLAVFAAACGDPEPTATPTPRPTPTPVPTATPTPLPPTPTPAPMPEAMPTAMPDPDTPTDQPQPGSPGEFVITDTTTVGELMSMLSQDELMCLSDASGGALDAFRDVPLSAVPPETMEASLPFQCFMPETVVNIQIAMMSLQAGGLSAETTGCIRGVAMEHPDLFSDQEPASPAEGVAQFGGFMQMILCMSDEEAAAFAGDDDPGFPPPSALRCMEEQLGSLEGLLTVFMGAEPDLAALGELFAAAQECGLDLAPPGSGSLQGQ